MLDAGNNYKKKWAFSDVGIIGAGAYKCGKYPDTPYFDYAGVAVRRALENAGVTWKQVQAIYAVQSNIGNGVANEIAYNMGRTGIPCISTEGYCVGGVMCVRLASTVWRFTVPMATFLASLQYRRGTSALTSTEVTWPAV